MFGYIRPCKPFMRNYEYEIYRSYYCGLCKDMGRRYGQIFRLTLSYDFAFLSLLCAAYNDSSIMKRQRCIAHPIKKRYCVCCGNDFEYTSAAAVISVYHKICDEINDSVFFKGLPLRLLRRLMKKAYLKAAEKLPYIAETVEHYMKEQSMLEQEKCPSIDRACEPTAQIMAAIASGVTDDDSQKKQLYFFGYNLGRFIYLADAHDDLEKDIKKKRYNPLYLNYNDTDGAKRFALDNINMSLGQAADAYTQCSFKRFRDICDNVVYMGLPRFRDLKKKKPKNEIKI